MLRLKGNNNGVSDAWRSGISEAKLDLDELEAIKKLLPSVEIKIDRSGVIEYFSDKDLTFTIEK